MEAATSMKTRSSREVRRSAEAKTADIEDKIRDLMRLKRTLEDLVEECSGAGSVSDRPIIHALDSPPTW